MAHINFASKLEWNNFFWCTCSDFLGSYLFRLLTQKATEECEKDLSRVYFISFSMQGHDIGNKYVEDYATLIHVVTVSTICFFGTIILVINTFVK